MTRARRSAATLSVIVLTLFSLAVQADARIAWTAREDGPLTAVDDDGVGARFVVAPAATGFELSPDGSLVAFAHGRKGVWVRGTAPGAAPARRVLPSVPVGVAEARPGSGPVRMAWAPDGRSLAVTLGHRVVLVGRTGRVAATIRMGGRWSASGVAFSPSGRRLAITRTDDGWERPAQLLVVARDGRGARRVRTFEALRSGSADALSPRWTTAGIVLAAGFVDLGWSSQGEDDYGAYLLPAGGGAPVLIADDATPSAVAAGWVVTHRCVWRIATRACAPGLEGGSSLAVSPAGDRVLVARDGAGMDRTLEIRRLDGGAGAAAAATPLPVSGPALDAQWR